MIEVFASLVHPPRLFIADEPTGNLDYWNAQQILDLLLKVNEGGMTVLMATHNREMVDLLHRRVVVLNSGVVVSDKEGSGYEIDLLTLPQARGMSPQPTAAEDLEFTEIVIE